MGVIWSYRFALVVNGRLNQLQITDYKLRFPCRKDKAEVFNILVFRYEYKVFFAIIRSFSRN